jgi:amino acid adenylation domain-containing protein
MSAAALAAVERWCIETPQAPAIREGDRVLTYGELWEGAATVAARLGECGVMPGDAVATRGRRSLAMITAFLGVWRAGAAYVPTDVSYPMSRVHMMVNDARAAAIVVDDDLPAAEWRVPSPRLGEVLDGPAVAHAVAPAVDDDPIAYVMFTSGSTGRPKGVAVGHEALANLLSSFSSQLGLCRDDVMLWSASPAFDMSALEVWLPLACGASVAIVRDSPTVEFAAFAAGIARAGVTVLQATPSAWRLMKEAGWRGSAVRWGICGGEALPDDIADWLSGALPRCLHAYGPTEATVWSTTYELSADDPVRPVPIGTPIDHTEILLLDEDCQPISKGEIGQIYIGGRGLAKGYLADDQLTAERFVTHPELSDRRVYATGDLGLIREGQLIFAGRSDNQVKIRGHRVELDEIRSELIRHEAISDAVVASGRSPDGSVELRAFVVPERELLDEAAAQETAQTSLAWHETFEANFDDERVAIEGDDGDALVLNGWVSSVTGERFASEEPQRWGDAAVSWIAALKPRRVLEIGSGGGLITRRLAPRCDAYLATDMAAAAVRRLRLSLAATGLDVPVEQMAAHEVRRLEPGQFDTVVSTSVIQYFPSERYLRDVLETAIDLLPEGGAIFLGDVRHAGLLRAFHIWRERLRAGGEVEPAELLGRATRRMAEEEELILDPGWFARLVEEYPRLAAVHTGPSLADVCNELTMFRYQATLLVGEAEPPAPTVPTFAWGKDVASAADLQWVLAEASDGLTVTGIPDGRVSEALWLVDELEGGGGEMAVGVDPARLAAIGRQQGFQVAVGHGALGLLDVRFAPASVGGRAVVAALSPPLGGAAGNRLVRDPSMRAGLARLRREHAKDIRDSLGERLPQYMIPRRLTFVTALPMMPNGKIDQRALAEMSSSFQGHRPYVAPRTGTESAIAEIWRLVLGVDADVGRDDSFIELGGHSLSVARTTVRLREHFGIELAMRLIFENPVVRDLASAIDREREAADGGAMPIRCVERPTLSEWQRRNAAEEMVATRRSH